MNSGIALGEEEECDVYIEYYFGKKGILIRIKDEGPGYDYKEEAEKKERRSKLTRDVVLHGKHPEDGAGGTGIYCLQNFADDFVHNESGTEVIVQFSL